MTFGATRGHALALDLLHAPSVEQQINVAEHLRQRQVGLRQRDVAPQLEVRLCARSRREQERQERYNDWTDRHAKNGSFGPTAAVPETLPR